jgi:hypothetical protein
MQGTPQTMQDDPAYENVVAEVKAFLVERIEACRAAGIGRERIVIDPGFGFGKTSEHNLELLRGLDRFVATGYPVLVGLSRKSVLGRLTGRKVTERVAASVAAAIANIFQALGASVKDGALKDLVAYVETLIGDLAKTMEAVAKNLPAALEKADLSGFAKGIQSVIDAFGVLFKGIDLTTVDGLTHAIELSGAAFLGLSNFTAGVIESFKPLFGTNRCGVPSPTYLRLPSGCTSKM